MNHGWHIVFAINPKPVSFGSVAGSASPVSPSVAHVQRGHEIGGGADVFHIPQSIATSA